MPVPDYQKMMRILLELLAKGETTMKELKSAVADDLQLSEEDRQARVPSGDQTLLANRVGWARTYLGKARLIESPQRGTWRITDRGRQALSSGEQIDNRYLRRFPEFLDFARGTGDSGGSQPPISPPPEVIERTPDELITAGFQQLQKALASDLLERVRGCSPEFFEHLVVELLVKMGYGGSLGDAGKAIGKSGDQGIDGIIKEDRLGLDVIYIQAKRWQNTVGRPDIQQFAGALQGQRARKGVFITTSTFSNEARDYAKHIETRIVLIDGDELARLMIAHGVGVTPVAVYEVKRVDSDYFSEE